MSDGWGVMKAWGESLFGTPKKKDTPEVIEIQLQELRPEPLEPIELQEIRRTVVEPGGAALPGVPARHSDGGAALDAEVAGFFWRVACSRLPGLAQATLGVTVSSELFQLFRDGVWLCQLLASYFPDAVDMRAVDLPGQGELTHKQLRENAQLFVASACAAGCELPAWIATDINTGEVTLGSLIYYYLLLAGSVLQVNASVLVLSST